MRNKIVTIRLTEEEYKNLKNLSDKEESFAAFIRKILKDFIKIKKKENRGLFGINIKK